MQNGCGQLSRLLVLHDRYLRDLADRTFERKLFAVGFARTLNSCEPSLGATAFAGRAGNVVYR